MVHFVYIVAASQYYSLKPFQDKSRLEPSTQEQPPEGLINGDIKNNWKVGYKETIEHEYLCYFQIWIRRYDSSSSVLSTFSRQITTESASLPFESLNKATML